MKPNITEMRDFPRFVYRETIQNREILICCGGAAHSSFRKLTLQKYTDLQDFSVFIVETIKLLH